MAKKFTQQELEEAFLQMQEERNQDYENAYKAAEWLQQQLGFGNCRVEDATWYPGGFPHITPQSSLRLKLIHETYGPYQDQYIAALSKASYATISPFPKSVGYTVDTPFGKYDIIFEYFDNHCTGY